MSGKFIGQFCVWRAEYVDSAWKSVTYAARFNAETRNYEMLNTERPDLPIIIDPHLAEFEIFEDAAVCNAARLNNLMHTERN